nr:Zn-dependent hydrolase [Defluviimonas salinarum]
MEPDLLVSDLSELAKIGATDSGGITRPAYSAAYKQAQAWLIARMQAAGLVTRVDPAGNIIGRIGPEDAQVIACGSHIDTVPGGGAYDGALGVLAGLSVARALAQHQNKMALAFEVIAFSDEEGAYLSEAGARAMAGDLTAREIHENIGRDGRKMSDALVDFGLDPEEFAAARRPASDFAAYLELHIEQGPVLEAAAVDIGVVESITGIHTGELTFSGQANHAGTTPIRLRHDAFRAAAETVNACFDKVEKSFPDETRITFGKVDVGPGATNVVPAEVVLSCEIRAGSEALISSVAEETDEIARSIAEAHGVAVESRMISREAPAVMDGLIVQTIEASCKAANVKFVRMNSGAGHDAQIMAGFCPTGMIFVPSQGGISHNPAEYTSAEQIEAGARVLLATVRALLREEERRVRQGF